RAAPAASPPRPMRLAVVVPRAPRLRRSCSSAVLLPKSCRDIIHRGLFFTLSLVIALALPRRLVRQHGLKLGVGVGERLLGALHLLTLCHNRRISALDGGLQIDRVRALTALIILEHRELRDAHLTASHLRVKRRA